MCSREVYSRLRLYSVYQRQRTARSSQRCQSSFTVSCSGQHGVNTEEYGIIRDSLRDQICVEPTDWEEEKVCCRSEELELTVERPDPVSDQWR